MKIAAPLLLTLALLLVAATWSRPEPPADITFVNRGEVFTLDPQRMSYLQDFRLAYALYEGLVRWNNEDLSIQPAAAELPEVSSDRLTYVFQLRPDVKWSDGDPVTAHDFVYSFQRLLWPDTAADYSNLLFVVDGAEAFFKWRSDQLAAFARSNRGQASSPQAAETLFEEAQRRFERTVGVTALDDRTLQIRLARPCAYLLDLLAFAVCSPVHRPTVEGWPDAGRTIDASRGWVAATPPPWPERRFLKLDPATGRLEQKHDWARPGLLVSNGPYILAQWRYKRDMRLERNPLFHSPELLRNESVLIRSIEDPNTMVLAYESGGVDWLGDLGVDYAPDMLEERLAYERNHATEIEAFRRQGLSLDEALASLPPPRAGERRDVRALPTFGVDFYSFNCRPTLADGRPNPFADAHVRRAFAESVDRQSIVDSVTRLHEPIVTTLIPPRSIPGYQSPAGLPFDPVQAKRELAQAGWIDRDGDGLVENERGEPFPAVDLLWTTNSSRYKWMSLALKSQWERTLGVAVELRGQDTKFYKDDLKQGKFMIARGRWYGDYSDPTTFLDINQSSNGNNDRGFASPRVDALLEEASKELDPAARLRTLQECERLIVEEELPLVPICQLVQLYMYEPGRLKGLTAQPRLVQYLWKLEAAKPRT